MPTRSRIEELAQRLGGASFAPLAGDASTRRFYRIHPPQGPPRIVMDYGAPFHGETDDMRLTRLFAEAGLPVPTIVGAHEELGLLLLEDLGSTLLESKLLDHDRARSWIEKAVALAARVAVAGTPVLARSSRAAGPALDAERLRFEMEFFIEHYATSLRGIRQPPGVLRRELLRLADRAAASSPPVLCHRDYHSRNLMVREDGSLVMVDIQDARWGPDSYDLASLLRDAYVPIDEGWIAPLIAQYLEALGESAPAHGFRERFDLVAAQRMLKALGTFGYQITVRGNRRYAEAIPRTLERLRRSLPEVETTLPVHRELEACGLLEPLPP